MHFSWATKVAFIGRYGLAYGSSCRVHRECGYLVRYCLVRHEKRRDGSRGARRRRFIDPPITKGTKVGKSIWFAGEKTDEAFHYLGSIHDLKTAIANAGGVINIVEGDIDVWSMRAMGYSNTVGICGITNIPKDIASIFDELGVTRLIYFADNDKAGERGGSNLRTLLHRAGWRGERQYRKFEGPGIPDKGDANDLLCHYFPAISQARAVLNTLAAFEPTIKRAPAPRPSTESYHDQGGFDAVKEAVRIALGIGLADFKRNGNSKNIRCRNPKHEKDESPSAGWHKDGFCKCFKCNGPNDTFSAIQLAEWLSIDWRALLRSQSAVGATNDIDLDAAPQSDSTGAPLSFDNAPDTWLRTVIKFYPPIMGVLFYFALRLCRTGPLAQGFTRGEFINALRPLGCNVNKRTIENVFQDILEHDDTPLFAKVDPKVGPGRKNCKFRLRSLDDIKRRLMHDISYRLYESTFHKHRDTLIGFQVFAEALQESKFASSLESARGPLYKEQKQRFNSLRYVCDQKIAAYRADLENLSSTPLPDWVIDKPVICRPC